METSPVSILHRIEISSPPETLYTALSTVSGLCGWWTTMTSGHEAVGKTLEFRFGAKKQGPDMEITALIPSEKVQWKCTWGPWADHTFVFEMRAIEGGCVLLFAQHGWPEASEFYMHCNSKWGYFLGTSLKKYCETGVGGPHPNDPNL